MKGSRSSLIFLLAATLLGRCEGRRTADKWAHQDSTLLPTANHSLPELHPVSLYQKPPTLRSAAEFLGYPSIAGLSPEFAMVALITTSAAVRVGLPRMLESFRFYLAKKNVATRREICDVYANFQRLCVPPSTATGDANSRQILEGIATLPEKDTAGRRAIEEAELTSGCRCAESPFGSKDSGLFDFYNLFAETPLTLEQASEACRREHGEKGGGKVFTSAYLHRPQSCVLKRLPPRFCCKKVASAPRPPVQHLLADPKRRTTNMLSERQIEALAWTLHKVGEECSDLQIPDTCGIGDFVTNSGSGTFGHFLGKWKDTIVGDLRNMIDPSYQLDRKVPLLLFFVCIN
uniref:Uncharacterized protein n=1 Tax=Chromera velia CCMP2878 TaxID=1169474 RepID=A0A0K6SAN7_9ALVE|eukprot:Cvel_11052.t2-p1 / transcript=Cvel_11052.t2 / gene=Cvel_11052 / organism=Chromera_velia_CCMP2878 / gene_product=hypothetical protein / transcript_product=hypothetical protein / location=Cvel_scaffold681:47890-50214(+) / protein_length=346 / sequence_SO=supercontig / SO=protein_coding / is_pseudo=false